MHGHGFRVKSGARQCGVMTLVGGEDEDRGDGTPAEEVVAPTPAEWQQFEKDAEGIFRKLAESDANASIEHNVKVTGVLSGEERQIDVLIKGELAGQPIRVVVECKCYGKPLGIGKIDEFEGKLRDVAAHRGVMFSKTGYTKPARARADHPHPPQITLYDLTVGRSVTLDFTPVFRFTGFGDCPNENCYTGDISWRTYQSEAGETLPFGYCDSCGTQAAQCYECDSIVGFVHDRDICESCMAKYQLVYDGDAAEVEAIEYERQGVEIEFVIS